jgi:hypothetical protein
VAHSGGSVSEVTARLATWGLSVPDCAATQPTITAAAHAIPTAPTALPIRHILILLDRVISLSSTPAV